MNNNLLKEISDYVSPKNLGQQGIADRTPIKRNDMEVSGLDKAYSVIKSGKKNRELNFYGKDGKSILDDIENISDKDEKTRFKSLVLSIMTTNKKDFSEITKNGYSPMDMDPEDFVTVIDKIKVQLIKSGVDLSMMGGIKDSALENIAGSKLEALNIESDLKNQQYEKNEASNLSVTHEEIESHLKENGISFDEDTIKDIKNAYKKVAEIKDNLKDGIGSNAAKYLIKNGMEPTVGNVYAAIFSGASKEDEKLASVVKKLTPNEDLRDSFVKVINDTKGSNEKVNDSDLKDAEWLYENELFVNKDNLNSVKDLYDIKVPEKQEFLKKIDSVMLLGLKPDEVNLSKNKSLFDKALSLLDAKLVMTKNAALTAQKVGISVNNAKFIESAELLRKINLEGFNSEKEKDLFKDTVEKVSTLENLPAETIGCFNNISSVNFDTFFKKAESVKEDIVSKNDIFLKLSKTYDGVGTEVRKDLGDSIKKAFRNIDSILSDLKLDFTEENRRAVKILGYNEIDITNQNIEKIKAEDLMMNRAFNNLKPGIVMKMIKNHNNPLDMNIDELLKVSESLKEETENFDSSSDMAEFLWKAENNSDLSKEERDAYVGIYRLIYQVNRNDHAAIGSLVKQNIPVTMRNLLKAVRTNKRKGMDYKIDDKEGRVESKKFGKSITDQIEIFFNTEILKKAETLSDSYKYKNIEDKLNRTQKKDPGEHILSMTPEELSRYLEKESTNEEINEGWENIKRSEFLNALKTVKDDTKTAEILEKLNIDKTPLNISMVNIMLTNGRKVFNDLGTTRINKDGSVIDIENPDIKALMEEVLERFGEKIKTPEDMAKAQKRLYDIAENAMKGVLASEDSTYVDIQRIKRITNQMSFYNKLSEDSIYHLPITVSGEDGVMTLKIVNGKDEKGMVDIFMETLDKNIYTKMRAYQERIDFFIKANDRDSYEFIKNNEKRILNDINKKFDKKVSINVSMSDISVVDMFRNEKIEKDNKKKGNDLKNNEEDINTSDLYEITSEYIHCIRNLKKGDRYEN